MKMNQSYQTQQEEAFKQELSFKEWLHYYMSEPTEQELNDMEKLLFVSIPPNSKTSHHLPSNSQHYNNPLKGA
jgi:hypothetical protein